MEGWLGNTEQLWAPEEEQPGLVGLGSLAAALGHRAQDENSRDEFLIDGKGENLRTCSVQFGHT